MSKENIKLFLEEIDKNPELKARFLEMMREYQQQVAALLTDKIIAIGKEAGFNFTAIDLDGLRDELWNQFNGNSDLNDEELAKVSGGRINFLMEDPANIYRNKPIFVDEDMREHIMPSSPTDPSRYRRNPGFL